MSRTFESMTEFIEYLVKQGWASSPAEAVESGPADE